MESEYSIEFMVSSVERVDFGEDYLIRLGLTADGRPAGEMIVAALDGVDGDNDGI